MKKNDFLKRYCMDKSGSVLVYKVFNNGQPLMQGELVAINNIPWNDLRRKANSSGKPWDTISVFRKGERKAIDFIKNKDARVKTV